MFLIWVNMAAVAVIFVHCVCRLSRRRWTVWQPELLAHAILCGGAVGVLGHSLMQGGLHHPSEIVINVGMAVYFLSQSWRRYLIFRFK
ncbi:hypothetical protein [Neisseria arctica]|uniref:hypothetical protein n=1 Tax=Neisseria arctica TaxID=1470200 RepID=UPI00069960A1|nr:hypothetical protein [Neisseria arctica]UOO87510.1 hypothetical protein LVJ86_04495 [Neisseria arctica]